MDGYRPVPALAFSPTALIARVFSRDLLNPSTAPPSTRISHIKPPVPHVGLYPSRTRSSVSFQPCPTLSQGSEVLGNRNVCQCLDDGVHVDGFELFAKFIAAIPVDMLPCHGRHSREQSHSFGVATRFFVRQQVG